MRKIAFRAWHKTDKQMYRVVALYLGKYEQSVSLMEDNASAFYSFTCPLADVELMEYIGRLDHHDIEMCEGDIVESIDNTSKGLVKKVVTITDIRHLPDFICSKWQEIIGNLYKNPELMEAASALGLVEGTQ